MLIFFTPFIWTKHLYFLSTRYQTSIQPFSHNDDELTIYIYKTTFCCKQKTAPSLQLRHRNPVTLSDSREGGEVGGLGCVVCKMCVKIKNMCDITSEPFKLFLCASLCLSVAQNLSVFICNLYRSYVIKILFLILSLQFFFTDGVISS